MNELNVVLNLLREKDDFVFAIVEFELQIVYDKVHVVYVLFAGLDLGCPALELNFVLFDFAVEFLDFDCVLLQLTVLNVDDSLILLDSDRDIALFLVKQVPLSPELVDDSLVFQDFHVELIDDADSLLQLGDILLVNALVMRILIFHCLLKVVELGSFCTDLIFEAIDLLFHLICFDHFLLELRAFIEHFELAF